jgi:hypothetical protein
MPKIEVETKASIAPVLIQVGILAIRDSRVVLRSSGAGKQSAQATEKTVTAKAKRREFSMKTAWLASTKHATTAAAATASTTKTGGSAGELLGLPRPRFSKKPLDRRTAALNPTAGTIENVNGMPIAM